MRLMFTWKELLLALLLIALLIGITRGGGFCDPTPEYGGQWPACEEADR